MPNPPAEVAHIGPHRFWVEDDMSIIVATGDVDASHVVALQQVNRPLSDRYGYGLSLVDARKIGTMTPEARRASSLYQRQNSIPGAVAVFGVGVMLSALVALYSRTIALFSTIKYETAMFETESEARAWLDSQRLKLRADLSQNS